MTEGQFDLEELDRKYEILGRLGEGGMGAVYKVRHRLLEEIRVIKMIRSQLKGHSEHEARFLQEAKTATRLRHEGIAQTYDFGVAEDGTAYIVMEFVDGTDLSVYRKSNRMLSVDAATDLACQCLHVLGYLHEQRFVHRDIAPDNIMLTQDGAGQSRVKLIDLGIAKPLEATAGLTRTGLFVGKLMYASPEQLGRETSSGVGPQSDLYSLGLVLYELLTGHRPIQGESEAAVIAGHLFHPPKDFKETDPRGRVPEELRAAVLKALRKSPEERFRSADEFRKALERARPGLSTSAAGAEVADQPTVILAESEPASAPPPLEKTRLTRGVKPRPAVFTSRFWSQRRTRWLLAGLAAVMLIGAAVVWWPERGELAVSRARTPGPPPDEPPPGLAELDFGSYHALVIGNDAYQRLPRLETAARDARDMASLLERKYGFKVRLLTDATRYEMITALTDVAASLTARDNLLLYYAGHGWLDPQSQSGYWQPVDAELDSSANWISTKYEVSAILGKLPARQILVVADSCYSAAISELVEVPPPGPPPGRGHVEHVRDLLARRSRLALTSGGLSPVLDIGDGEHSVFSKVLLNILGTNSRIAETSRLFGELKSRVSTSAKQFGVEQDPVLAPIPQTGDEGGDFFFVPVSG